MTLENLLKNGLITALKGNDTFWTSIGGSPGGGGNGRLRYLKEEAGIARPYVRFSFGPSAQLEAFRSDTPVATEVLIYFDIFSASGGTKEMEDIHGYLHTAIDSLRLTLAGYRALGFRRGPELATYEEDSTLWHTNSLYRSYANPT